MAAIVHFTPAQAHDLALAEPIGSPRRGHRLDRPPLHVIEGGRSPRSMARVYARRRLAALVAVVVLAVVLVVSVVVGLEAAGAALGSAATPAATASAPGPVLVVQRGDTLWAIARRIHPTGDITGLVDRLAAAHGPGPLLAGDRLPLGTTATP